MRGGKTVDLMPFCNDYSSPQSVGVLLSNLGKTIIILTCGDGVILILSLSPDTQTTSYVGPGMYHI